MRLLTSAAPSERDFNLAKAMSGSTAPKPAKVPNPQSEPATTLCVPTISTNFKKTLTEI